MENQYISLELSKKLYFNGCQVPSSKIYTNIYITEDKIVFQTSLNYLTILDKYYIYPEYMRNRIETYINNPELINKLNDQNNKNLNIMKFSDVRKTKYLKDNIKIYPVYDLFWDLCINADKFFIPSYKGFNINKLTKYIYKKDNNVENYIWEYSVFNQKNKELTNE